MKVYCVMKRNLYYFALGHVDELCSIWLSRKQAENVTIELNEETESPYVYYVREEEAH